MTGLTPALIGLGTILTVSTLVWMISVRLGDASIADICWGLGFVLLAWLYCLLSPTLTPRSWLVAVLVTLWGARLSWHIFSNQSTTASGSETTCGPPSFLLQQT